MIKQYEIYLVNLDPTIGYEIRKSRPCIVISPNEMNNTIGTIIIAPMTTKSHNYPSRVPITFQNKSGFIVLDQIRTIDKRRIVKRLGLAEDRTVMKIKNVIKEMLIE